MFNKMVKMKNRKGFTLVEMLVVIAILAILVSILVPVIGNSTVKARAATNAANLRAVEAQLATMKVSNPEYFKPTSAESPGTELSYVINYVFGEGASVSFLDKRESTSDGTIIFPGDGINYTDSLTVENIPLAKAVSCDYGMNVADGAHMVVYLIDNEIVAAYEGVDGIAYNIDCFAEVAETGKFTGEGFVTDTGYTNQLICGGLFGNGHSYISMANGTHKCSKCYKLETCTDSTGAGSLFDQRSNGECDDCGYGCMHNIGTFNGITKCEHCGKSQCVIDGVEHQYVDNVCSVCHMVGEHTCADSDKNHLCDICNEVHSQCEANASNKYQCSVCGCACPGYKSKYGLGACDNCGHNKSLGTNCHGS